MTTEEKVDFLFDQIEALEKRVNALEMHTGYGKGGKHIKSLFYARLYGTIFGNLSTLLVMGLMVLIVKALL